MTKVKSILSWSSFAVVLLVYSASSKAEDHDAVVAEIRSILDPLVDEQMLPGYYLGVFDEKSSLFEVSMGSTREAGELRPQR